MALDVYHYTILGCFLLLLEEGENHDISGRAAYIKVCERLGIVPASYFLKNITNPSICMKHHGLGVQGTRAVAKVLKVNIIIIIIIIIILFIIIIIIFIIWLLRHGDNRGRYSANHSANHNLLPDMHLRVSVLRVTT